MKSMKTLKTQTVTVFPADDIVDLLIQEVERRPILYDKHTKGYSDNNIRKKEWDEVAIALKGEETWNSMSPEEKKEAGYQLQKRWLNLRNCFARELRVQRSDKPKSRGKKRRKYCYFDQLMFLLPTIELRQNIGSGNDNSDDYDDYLEAEYIDTSSPPHDANPDTEYSDMQMDEQSINISVPSPSTDCDEDKLFVLSLVPLLRRLTDYEKLDMKVKILNLFKSSYHAPFKTHFNSSSCQDIKHNIQLYNDDSDKE